MTTVYPYAKIQEKEVILDLKFSRSCKYNDNNCQPNMSYSTNLYFFNVINYLCCYFHAKLSIKIVHIHCCVFIRLKLKKKVLELNT